ncbi:MAG: hypothetical protein EA340_04850 [Nitriliruptor sp.]|nr:MAG: hypothetical protein EA340_04850 [Nitriliruptor sp.]
MATNRVLGLLLIGLGGVLLLAATTNIGGEVVVGFIGVAFLVAYATTRTYGFLIPGGILTGLGTGLVLESLGVRGDIVVLGLGLGFVAIAVVDQLVSPGRPGWWWPFIPGGVLLLASAGSVTGLPHLGRYLVPGLLILAGAALLLRRGGDDDPDAGSPELTQQDAGRAPDPPPPPPPPR